MMEFIIDYSDKKIIGKEKVTSIGLGTWGIRNYKRAEEAIIHAVELGINHVDTAEMYGSGKAEELVGRVLRVVGKENLFVTTKLMPDKFVDKERAVKAAQKSLSRLGLSTVDLILIHWPQWSVPISTQIRSLEAILDNGLARYIGVSNFNRTQLEEALTSLKKAEIVVNQVKYSILDRAEVENELLEFSVKNNITIQAYTPLERGEVTYNRVIKSVAEKKNKTPVQIALNYLISHKNVVAIPKTERKERVEEFYQTMGWRLSLEDILYLKQNV